MTTIFLTSNPGTLLSWNVPLDWSSSANTIECIAGGGIASWQQGGKKSPNIFWGAGGGAYSKVTNVGLPRGGAAYYFVGNGLSDPNFGGSNGGQGGPTWFNSSIYGSASVAAEGGWGFNQVLGSVGGSSFNGIGTVLHSGGDGMSDTVNVQSGGAAGPNGNGVTATAGVRGGAGDSSLGGAGGLSSTPTGKNGTEWDATHGSGGGSFTYTAAGGTYGGGGNPSGQGIIVITYTPSSAPPLSHYKTNMPNFGI